MSKPTRDECIAYLLEAVGARAILEDVGLQTVEYLRGDVPETISISLPVKPGAEYDDLLIALQAFLDCQGKR